ncbi:MAG: LysR family transcriptional regulator [Acidaminococcus sp.]|nr:LysR family transcriptional regulator [Acidaminococcus sp.]MCI2100156.1 LysR family transcriptional regulator [Acidaminococcus sp.]MCI2114475.1 LysR family transcriptional regulator [Acidaminococcus sp.]MCI2116410.1 LysR family transcriptional regulator [Acidaminococcus sp.]
MFRYMDYIYTVYEEHSFSRAAQKMHISQSSLSITIARAEKEIGAKIFNRGTNPISLTEFGISYIESVKTIYALKNDLEEYIRQMGAALRGRVAIGASSFFSTYLLTHTIQKFRNTYPHVKIELFDHIMPELEKKLDSEFIDFIVSNTKKTEERYRNILLFPDYLYLMVVPKLCPQTISPAQSVAFEEIGHEKNPRAKSIDLTQFAEVPFLLLHPGNNLRYSADNLLEKAGVHPPIVLEVDETMTLYPMVKAGLGATIVGSYVIRMLGKPGDALFFPLAGKEAKRGTYLNVLKNKRMTPALREFIKELRNYCTDVEKRLSGV